MDYVKLIEVAQGLKTITEHVKGERERVSHISIITCTQILI